MQSFYSVSASRTLKDTPLDNHVSSFYLKIHASYLQLIHTSQEILHLRVFQTTMPPHFISRQTFMPGPYLQLIHISEVISIRLQTDRGLLINLFSFLLPPMSFYLEIFRKLQTKQIPDDLLFKNFSSTFIQIFFVDNSILCIDINSCTISSAHSNF